MLQVADQLAEDPGLIGVGNASVLLLHHRLGQHLAPRVVVQRHLLELALVNTGGVLTGDRWNLVGDRDQRVEALLAGNVEIGLQLFRTQQVCSSFDLDQRSPGLVSTGHSYQPIGVHPPVTAVELANGRHHGEHG
jgi:hypothetical protein